MVIKTYNGPIPEEVLQLIETHSTYLGYLLIADDSRYSGRGAPKRNDETEILKDSDAALWVCVAMVLGAMLFGRVHLWAWNFGFPTRIELWIWRGCGIWTIVWGPAVVLLGLLLGRSEILEARHLIIIQILTLLYILTRLALLAEGFRTLLYLPEDAFISTWASEIPHVG